MAQHHAYTSEQKLAICDALNELVAKCNGDTESFLKIVAPGRLFRTMKIEIIWDEEQKEFRCQ